MKVQWLVLLITATLLIGPAAAQDIEVSWVGVCEEFNVTVRAELEPGCWDVKLDVPGRVLSQGVWRSSVYYVNGALCWPETQAFLQVRLDTAEGVVQGTAKLRQNSTIMEKDFVIRQECPGPPGWEVHLIMGVIFGVFFVILGVWWWKGRK